jgi:hypothetical protein
MNDDQNSELQNLPQSLSAQEPAKAELNNMRREGRIFEHGLDQVRAEEEENNRWFK